MTTYFIGDNTGGKYIAGEGGKAAVDTLKSPTLLLKVDKSATAMGLKLLHDRGAVYTHATDVDGKRAVRLGATGSDPVIKNFEKWEGEDYEGSYAVIPYTTPTECMIAFTGRKGWMNDGKKLKEQSMSSGDNRNNVELADGILVIDFSRFTPDCKRICCWVCSQSSAGHPLHR